MKLFYLALGMSFLFSSFYSFADCSRHKGTLWAWENRGLSNYDISNLFSTTKDDLLQSDSSAYEERLKGNKLPYSLISFKNRESKPEFEICVDDSYLEWFADTEKAIFFEDEKSCKTIKEILKAAKLKPISNKTHYLMGLFENTKTPTLSKMLDGQKYVMTCVGRDLVTSKTKNETIKYEEVGVELKFKDKNIQFYYQNNKLELMASFNSKKYESDQLKKKEALEIFSKMVLSAFKNAGSPRYFEMFKKNSKDLNTKYDLKFIKKLPVEKGEKGKKLYGGRPERY